MAVWRFVGGRQSSLARRAREGFCLTYRWVELADRGARAGFHSFLGRAGGVVLERTFVQRGEGGGGSKRLVQPHAQLYSDILSRSQSPHDE